MSFKRSAVAVIPARGGSKGIPRKNICNLGGKPLIAYSIEAALKSKEIDRVIVTTEDDEIGEVARSFGAEVPFVRPKYLADDNVPGVEAVIHTLKWIDVNEERLPNIVVMLLPTSPLRTAEDIDSAVALFKTTGALSVVSVAESDKQLEHFRDIGEDGVLLPLVNRTNYNVQRQDLKKLYYLNGSIYVSTPKILMKEGSFHVKGAVGYVMLGERSVDINHKSDLEYADLLIRGLR